MVVDFLQQDYPERELLILNNHPEPLELPEGIENANPLPLSGRSTVRIFNTPGFATLGDCRNQLLALAGGEYVRTWDDDDVYLPWTLSQGVAHIGDEIAFKPGRSWFDQENQGIRLEDNVFEAAMLTRSDFAREHPYQPTAGDEHQTLVRSIEERGLKRRDFGPWASYVYRWGYGVHHISGTMGSGTVEDRTENWKKANNDSGAEFGGVLDLRTAYGERIDFYHRMAPYAGEYRHEFFSRCAQEPPPESLTDVPLSAVHELATKDLVKDDQQFCAMEFGRDAEGSTRDLLSDPRVGILISVDPHSETFEAVKAGLSMENFQRIQMLGEIGDCSGCQGLRANPNYLTLDTGCAMENLQSFLKVCRLLAPNARISVPTRDGFLLRSVLEPTHKAIALGDYLLFYPRVLPEFLRWPPACGLRTEA